MNFKIVRRTAAIGVVAAIGCVTGRVPPVSATAGRDWTDTITQAQAAATDHRYADADRLLADYAARYPGSEGAIEGTYWRGVIALEPANRDATPQIAAALFETYNRSGGALPHRLEAAILYRAAMRLHMLPGATVTTAAASSAPSPSTSSNAADVKAKDVEIQRLKDELAKANDELERIKRRLTAPTKP